MLNELLGYVEEVQEKGTPFHYSWLLILISFLTWAEPPNYQGVYVLVQYRGDRYQNIWIEKEKSKKQKDDNVKFFLQGEAFRYYIKKKAIITMKFVKQFHNIIHFSLGVHHIFLDPQQDPKKQSWAIQFHLFTIEIDAIVQDWPT